MTIDSYGQGGHFDIRKDMVEPQEGLNSVFDEVLLRFVGLLY